MNGLVPAESQGSGMLTPLTAGGGSFGDRLRAFTAQRLGDEEGLGRRMKKAGRVELHELHVGLRVDGARRNHDLGPHVHVVHVVHARHAGHAAAFADMGLIRVAVNQEYGGLDSLVQAGDEVAFFPPVTGG